MNNEQVDTDYELLVVGGGPAGLQAALTAGRMHSSVLQIDSGEYRNATVDEMHNLLGRDGSAPADLRAAGLAELANYDTVESRTTSVESIVPIASPDTRPLFRVGLEGGEEITARAVIVATGIRDTLPDIDGISGGWGGRIASCPFCHGHEFAGERIGILGAGLAGHMSLMLGPIGDSLAVFAQGQDVPEGLASDRIDVLDSEMRSVTEDDAGLTVTLSDGTTEEIAGLFLMPAMKQRAEIVADLVRDPGLDCSEMGFVKVDERGRTSIRGLYAAGDMAVAPNLPMPMFSVANAIGSGAMAGATFVADLIMPA